MTRASNGEKPSGETNGHSNNPEDLAVRYGWTNTNDAGYSIIEKPSGRLRPIKIICLGAGASGINCAKQFQDQIENVHLQIYDKNADVGGTWLENRYP